MSYLALARKWRPRTFSQLVGQEHISKALVNALNRQRLHHAYLFTGTRGVGKTSVARILAKAFNCEKGISAEPCLSCETCISIEQGRFLDLIEIDGASKTRVEDTRELLDNVQYAPTSGRFKIYLIDEVHMLSQHSFNALLKTLEEPPTHVKFILATTDPQKLPITVLSRCLQFHLKHLSKELISQHLQLILNDEQLEYELDAVDILAHAAQGSMRDGLSLLDQAITSCSQRLQSSDVKMLLGYTQQNYAIQLIGRLAEQNPSSIIDIIEQISKEGGHFQFVLDEIINHLHQITVYQIIGDQNPLINVTPEVKTIAQQLSPEDVQLFYQIALKGREEIHLAPTLALGFSMTILRMFTFRPMPLATKPHLSFENTDACSPSVSEHVQKESTQTEPLIIKAAPSLDVSFQNEDSIGQEQDVTAKHEIVLPNDHEDWISVVQKLKLSGLALNALENAEFVSKIENEIILKVAKGHHSLFTPTAQLRIEAALTNYYKNPIKINLKSENSIQTSPAQHKQRISQEKQQKAELSLQKDPVLQQIQKEFSAELVKNSIVPLKDDL